MNDQKKTLDVLKQALWLEVENVQKNFDWSSMDEDEKVEKLMPRFVIVLRACGWSPEEFMSALTPEELAEFLISRSKNAN